MSIAEQQPRLEARQIIIEAVQRHSNDMEKVYELHHNADEKLRRDIDAALDKVTKVYLEGKISMDDWKADLMVLQALLPPNKLA